MAGFGCCAGDPFGGGKPKSFGRSGEGGSKPGVKCYCQEVLLVTLNIEVEEEKTPSAYLARYSSFVEVIRTSGCNEKKWEGLGDQEFQVTTDGIVGSNKWTLFISWLTGQNCGDCAPSTGIPSFGKLDDGSDQDACEFTKSLYQKSHVHTCECVSKGTYPPPPCACGVIFNIVNSITYAQKCVLACLPGTSQRPQLKVLRTCYWVKVNSMGQPLTPLKPGYVLSPLWNTKYCNVRNEPWKVTLLTDVKNYLISIGAPILRGCQETKKDCDSLEPIEKIK